MSENMIILLSSIFGSTVLAAIIGYFTAKKKYPNETRNSKADAAEKITNSAVVLTESMVRRFVLLEERTSKLEKHIGEQDVKITSLKNHIDLWIAWAARLRADWHSVRLQEEPPDVPYSEVDEPLC